MPARCGSALQVRADLARKGAHLGAALPDLLIAATAERHRVTVLHHDHAYDLIASVTGQPVDWIIPGGSAGTANNDEGGIGSAAEPFGGRGDQQVRQGSPEVRGRRNATPRAPSRGVGPTECTGVVRQPRNQA
jgi:hypothetical protein